MRIHRTVSRAARLALLAIAAAILGLLLAPTAARAAAPQLKSQAPGYYRMTLGDFEITALSDGTMDLPVAQLLTGIQPGEADALLKKQFLASPVETSVNAFLVNTGAKLVLVDTGAGVMFGPTVGKLLTTLKAAGYSPEQVDDVVVTHMHGDHIGGLGTNGHRAFPNAVVHADRHDADYWLSKANLEQAPADRKEGFQGAMASLQPYIDAKKFETFEAGGTLLPGIGTVAAHGHTPGHTLYVVESKGQKLVLWGDLLHVAAVQFPKPAVTIQFDTDSPKARISREKALADAAAGGYWVGIAHVAFPGLGHVRKESAGYVWVPANYSANRSGTS